MSAPDPKAFDFGPDEPYDWEKVAGCAQKNVHILYGTHALFGKLFLLTPEEFTNLHCRFLDISPQYVPNLSERICEPWTLLHPTLGTTWIHVGDLPQAAYMRSAFDALEERREPSFIALTQSSVLYDGDMSDVHMRCDMSGNLTLEGSKAVYQEDVIIALASHRSFNGVRPFGLLTHRQLQNLEGVCGVNYPPRAVEPSLIALMKVIQAGYNDPAYWTAKKPRKTWLKQQFPELTDGGGYMNQKHPLYKHRGNAAIFSRIVWHVLCYPVSYSEDAALEKRKDEPRDKIPPPYYQPVFADLQARVRVDDTGRLTVLDDKYHDHGPSDISNLLAWCAEQDKKDNGDTEMADSPRLTSEQSDEDVKDGTGK